jgi:Tol biopolymer transport system component
MKKPILLFLLIVALSGLSAQQMVVQSISKLSFSESGGYFYPKFSPDAAYLLLTSASYSGLQQFTLADQQLRELSSDPGAGYNVQVSADGTRLLYTKIEMVDRLRYNSLQSLSLSTGEKRQLTAPGRDAIAPSFSTDKPVYVKSKALQREGVATAELKPVLTIEDRKMVVYSASGRKVLDPVGNDASYIWPSFSPDGKKILFTAAGRGSFVCTADGKNLVSLGRLNAPVWLNQNWVVGMNDRDDGGRVVESTLWAVTTNGKIRQQLPTPDGLIAMYPAVSPDGSKIAFNSDRGEIFMMQVITR